MHLRPIRVVGQKQFGYPTWSLNLDPTRSEKKNRLWSNLGCKNIVLLRPDAVGQNHGPYLLTPLQWRHNGHDGVSNHQPHDCLLNRLFGCRSKKTSKLRVTGLCAGNSPLTGEFPAQMASNAENISIWWRHHVSKRECPRASAFTGHLRETFPCHASHNRDWVLHHIGLLTFSR